MQEMNLDWWRGALIYQIYPRSFMDSNQDGIGDLPGITAKLDYISSLNVDAIWLSPFFTSPMKDFGYDVSNYRDVAPMFGTLEDFDRLLAGAHERNIKVIIDQVLSHTSDQHPWFEESRQSSDNPKSDWFVWADSLPDGTPPNNWLSVFGGSAWTWDSRRRQYYLHNFLASQPDLNFHNPAVVEQLLSDVEFWLKRGVDGFRLDTANFYYHDQQLRNNPANEKVSNGSIGVRLDNPYAYQSHVYDKSRPENLGFLRKLRTLLDQYPGTTTVGEVGCDRSLETMADYTAGGDKLHMAYSFDLLTEQKDATFIRHTIESIESQLRDGWPCWSIGNHDVQRVASRWAQGSPSDKQSILMMALQLSLRGSFCIYQGEELGLTEAELELEELQDPYGIAFWPEFKGRDGCRTPHPWQEDQLNAGFSEVKPWLPVPAEHYKASVSHQDTDPHSVLNAYRSFAAWRRGFPTLIKGDIQFLDAPENCLMFLRTTGEQKMLVAINLTDSPRSLSLPAGFHAEQQILDQFQAKIADHQFHLQALDAGFALLTPAEQE
ncbi:alpha-glucosidase family protein [Motiliproteus sp. MSK22-1]|uniref:alpha-glucosidase family protein n=1 Tax=Motiliproteus sp. MSK22-1 TaxID=1897630 RepID=UPI00097822E4|nr:alpha-glucosidase family protein [Motiliproteus sp. MSK22-1]OMH29108.1 alpha-glucosidase [Motiliproteus sp. MSK22-1]